MTLAATGVLLGSGALAFWALLFLDRPRRWSARTALPGAEAQPGPRPARIAAIVPARNEAELLPRTLPALLGQEELDTVLVVDDRSSDGTLAVARALARGPGRPTVLAAGGRPEGWMGKVHALARGVAALGTEADWLLLTDADVLHPPDSARRLLARARAGPHDLVSVMARLRTRTAAERLLIPAFVWFFHLMYPFSRVADPRSRVAAAAGGCILIRRRLLEDLGGLAAIRGAVIDDLALARRAKDAGGRLWLGHATDLVSVRAYSFRGIVDMVSRSAFAELRWRYERVPLVWAFLLAFFVSPPVTVALGLAAGEPAALALGLAAHGLEAFHAAPVFRHHGVGRVWALALPLAALLYAGMTTLSAVRHARRAPLRWREG